MNAYSEDLREKIIEALGRGMGKSEAARTFSVSLSSVKRYAKLAEEGRPLAPKKRPGSKPKLDERSSKLLEEDLKERPFITLQQRCEYLRTIASLEVSRSTVCRAIKRMNSTRKKGEDRPDLATGDATHIRHHDGRTVGCPASARPRSSCGLLDVASFRPHGKGRGGTKGWARGDATSSRPTTGSSSSCCAGGPSRCATSRYAPWCCSALQ